MTGLLEIGLEIIGRKSKQEIAELVNNLSLHLDKCYRSVGGSGFRVASIEPDEIMGIEISRTADFSRWSITIRLLPRGEDAQSVMTTFETMSDSPEFIQDLEAHLQTLVADGNFRIS